MREIKRKLERLSEMSWTEVEYRLQEKARRQWDRLKIHLGAKGLETDAEVSASEYLNHILGKRFYISGDPATRDQIRWWVSRNRVEWMTRSIEEGQKLVRRHIPILGCGEVDLGPQIDWHRDPVTGRIWKRRFCADYDLVRDCSGGDGKIIHELNRHQHLPRLAKAYYFTGDERFAREAVVQIESWIEQNPRCLGVNWQSSLDIAIRSISWLWTFFFLLPFPSFAEEPCRRILHSLFDQLDYVCRYPSVFSSPNTHLIGEAAALLIAGILFRGAKRSEAWFIRGRELLLQTLESQISNEGIHTELSPYYHAYAFDFYLQVWVLARKNEVSLPSSMAERLRLMLEFMLHVAREDGTLPLIGDDDGGRALALAQQDYGNVGDALCTGAVLFGRSDFKYQANGFQEETLWLLGPESAEALDRLHSTPPTMRDACYPDAGYFIQRTGWSRHESQLIFDAGRLGGLGGAHGHADALSVTLFTQGREVLVDPGTFVYNCKPKWRTYFRGTAAHNTVVIDGQDQSIQGGTFRWIARAGARCVKNASLPEVSLVEGEHDGYLRLSGPVIHRRRIVHIRPDYWLIFDHFTGEGEHEFELLYHFSPECEIKRRAATVRTRELVLYIGGSQPMKTELIRGQNRPPQGWISRRYGHKTAAPVLRAHFRSHVPAGFVSVLFPLAAAMPKIQPIAAPALWAAGSAELGSASCRTAATTATSVEYDGFHDYSILAPPGREIRVGEFRLEGELFYLRTENGHPKFLLGINARRFQQKGTTLLEETEPVSYVVRRFGGGPLPASRDRARGNNICAESAAL